MMIDSPIFWLMFLGHLLGDFYFQSERMAKRKRQKLGWRMLHCLLYALGMGFALSPVLFVGYLDRSLLWVVLGIPVVSHAVIDLIKEPIARAKSKDPLRKERRVFLIDQALHIGIILGVALYYDMVYAYVDFNAVGQVLSETYWQAGLTELAEPMQALRAICLFLLIIKPANVAIRVVIAKKEERKQAVQPVAVAPVPQEAPGSKKTTLLAGRPHDVLIQVMGVPEAEAVKPAPPASPPTAMELEGDPAEMARTGRWIGALERILVVVLMMMGEYAAIGLVFTAKSLTRFDRIAKDKGFAEYYLIGTLSSILFAMAALFLSRPMA